MSGLVGNPEDRFSHNEAQIDLDIMLMTGTGSMLKKKQQQESIPASQRHNHVETGSTTTIQDDPGKCLIEEPEILNRLMEYYSDLYNYLIDGD